MIPPTPTTSTTPAKGAAKSKGQKGKGLKRTYSSTNTAPDYAEAALEPDSVSDNYYPAYLFQTPPGKLTMDHLHKHALISKIERNKAQIAFFQLEY